MTMRLGWWQVLWRETATRVRSAAPAVAPSSEGPRPAPRMDAHTFTSGSAPAEAPAARLTDDELRVRFGRSYGTAVMDAALLRQDGQWLHPAAVSRAKMRSARASVLTPSLAPSVAGARGDAAPDRTPLKSSVPPRVLPGRMYRRPAVVLTRPGLFWQTYRSRLVKTPREPGEFPILGGWLGFPTPVLKAAPTAPRVNLAQVPAGFAAVPVTTYQRAELLFA